MTTSGAKPTLRLDERPKLALYGDVVGQPEAVRQLRAAALAPVHAFLIVGPAGTGKLLAARSLAASLMCDSGGCGHCDVCCRVLDDVHPDFRVVQRQGAAMSVDDAAGVVRAASIVPVEAARKVIVLDEIHLVDRAGPALLKTIEEPPSSTYFIALANFVPAELVTIASRCLRIDFGPAPVAEIERVLRSEGVEAAAAEAAASSASGSIERARLLAEDPGLADRLTMWRSITTRLDGSGHAAAVVVDEVLEMIDGIEATLLVSRHEAEMAGLAEREEHFGKRGAGRAEVEKRHNRERRRVRADELRLGLSALADQYRQKLGGSDPRVLRKTMATLEKLGAATEALIRNPNEQLLLSALFLDLSAP